MQPPGFPANEAGRLQALRSFDVLDTGTEETFDAITALAARLLGVPMALVSFVDAHRQWFKSRVGVTRTETAREVSFCGHVVADGAPLVVADALEDARFADNPAVVGAPGIRSYIGYPLRTDDGHVLGTICAMDTRPRAFGEQEVESLGHLAGLVRSLLEQRRLVREVRRGRAEAQQLRAGLDAFLQYVPAGLAWVNRDLSLRFSNTAFRNTFAGPEGDPGPDGDLRALLGPARARELQPHWEEALAGDHVRFTLPVPDALLGSALHDVQFIPDDASGRDGFLVLAVEVSAERRLLSRLAERERLQAALLAALPGEYYRLSHDGTCLEAHGRGLRHIRQDASEFVGRTLSELAAVPGLGDRAEVFNRYQAAALRAEHSGQVETFEYSYLFPTGRRWFEARVTHVKESDEFVAFATDVTSRERAIERAQATNRFLTTVLQVAPAAILVVDRRDGCLVASAASREILGIDVSSLRGGAENGWHYFDEDGHERAFKDLRCMEAVRACRPYGPALVKLRNAAGEPRWVQVSAVPIPDQAERAVLVGLDVTPGIRARDEQVEHAERWRAVTTANPSPLAVVDDEGRVVDVNPAFTARFGISLEAARGVDFPLVVGADSVPPLHGPGLLERLRRGGPDGTTQALLAGRDGTTSLYELRSTPIRIVGLQHHLVLIRDLGERSLVEQAIAERELGIRRSLAFDLHDGVSQTLVAARFQARNAYDIATGPLKDGLSKLESLLGRAIEQTATLTRSLSAVEVAREGLSVALESLATGARHTHGIDCRLEIDEGTPDPTPLQSTQAFLIAEEAVASAARHTTGSTITLRLRKQQRLFHLTVHDDGRLGTAIQEGDLEIRNMQYRASLIGGELRCGATASSGFRVDVRWPEDPAAG